MSQNPDCKMPVCIPNSKSIESDYDDLRHKMLVKGRNALSDTETLSIILGTENNTATSLEIARRIMKVACNNLAEISKMTAADLSRIEGVNHNKAASIMAAFELGRRRNEAEVLSKEKISSSSDAFEVLYSVMCDQPYEEFWILVMNKANRVICKCCISEGGISGTVVDPKKVFKIALDHHASSLILGHNHPSGNIQPSEADQKITRKIRDSGMMLDIAILDHLIIGENSYFSFADEGML